LVAFSGQTSRRQPRGERIAARYAGKTPAAGGGGGFFMRGLTRARYNPLTRILWLASHSAPALTHNLLKKF